MAAVWASVALAGPPTKPAPLELPVLSLPAKVTSPTSKGVLLTPSQAIELFFAPASRLGGPFASSLGELWGTPQRRTQTTALLAPAGVDGEHDEVHAVGEVTITGQRWRLLRLDQQRHASTSSAVYAFLLGPDGAPVGGGLLAESGAFGPGGSSESVTIREDGGLTSLGANTLAVMDVPGLVQLDSFSTVDGTFHVDGGISWGHSVPLGLPSGRWWDARSGERLIVAAQEDAGVRVFYAGNTGKPWQELDVAPSPTPEQFTVRFKGKKPQPYVLSLRSDHELTCRNPDGRVQTFTPAD